jgi:hypothetical protein
MDWITEGAGPLDQDELEELLYDGMDESFNADIEDGSVEEVFFCCFKFSLYNAISHSCIKWICSCR